MKTSFQDRIADGYNQLADADWLGDYYGGSDFLNVGYWDAGTRSQRDASVNLVEKLLEFIPRKTGSILDVACGKGATTRHLTLYYDPRRVTGINISDKQLEHCRRNAPGCTFLQMDSARMRFPDASFNNVICVEAACHFDTRKRFLREAHRVLKPGGRLVLSDVLLAPESRIQPPANYVEDPDRYRRLCLAAGFDHVVVTDVTGRCWDAHARALARHMRRGLADGTVTPGQYRGAMAWLWASDRNIEHYVLAACVKS